MRLPPMTMCRAVYLLLVSAAFGAVCAATPAFASNVDLSTVPKRDSVQLTIYNSEDLTLVRETRTVTFKKGVNPLQFSWANTLVDPTSVELTFLTGADKLDVLDTTYPHDKPQMLYWNVQSEIDGEATIQITYFTSGITWSADYLLIADKDEKQLSFDGFVRVFNKSGEEYEDAQVRLVVGTINLVEKIAQLAQVPANKAVEFNAGANRVEGKGLTETYARPNPRPGLEARMTGGQRKTNHQRRPERILHLHDRRNRDDPKRLVEADALARRDGRAVQDPISLSPAGIRRAARADVLAHEQQGIEARHVSVAQRRGAGIPRERPRRAFLSDATRGQIHPDR